MRSTRRIRSLPTSALPALALAGLSTVGSADAVAAQDLSCRLQGATMAEAEARPSPLRTVEFSFDGGQGLLCYGAPSARGRDIMGGLVPYGQPWRTGANEPTTIHLSAPATIGGVEVAAGSYAIYTIPGESEWEVIINPNHERWGIPINDAVRATEIGSFTVNPVTLDDAVEMLTFSAADGGLAMEWENTRIVISIG